MKEALEKESYKGKFISLKCDITKEQDIESSFKWILQNVGKPSVLINNAGVCIREHIESKRL